MLSKSTMEKKKRRLRVSQMICGSIRKFVAAGSAVNPLRVPEHVGNSVGFA